MADRMEVTSDMNAENTRRKRGGQEADPVRGLPGSKPLTRCLSRLPSFSDAETPGKLSQKCLKTLAFTGFSKRRPFLIEFLARSWLAEAAVELPVVPAVHVAVAVEIEVPQVAGLAGVLHERGAEEVAILAVHVAVAVGIAEQPEEAVHLVASRRAVAVPVQLPAPAVVDPVGADRQGVTTVRQRAPDELGPGEGEDGHGLAADHRDGDLRIHQAAVLPA